jgi:capsular exopolysaccharide synthesis family protein
MSMTTGTDQEEADAGLEFDESEGINESGSTWLHASPSGGALATEVASEWLFRESDELFRGIYTRAATGFGAAEVVAIASAISGEGKTTIGIGLAVTLAQDFPDRRVLLVETDLQRPVLADDFGVQDSPGLVDCLLSGEPLQNALRATSLDNLHILPAGLLSGRPGRPLRSSQMAAAVDAMRQNYDVVILDLPALLANSDSALLTDLADGVICVLRTGVTPIALFNRALEQLEEGKLRGVVLNGSDSAVPGWIRRMVGA